MTQPQIPPQVVYGGFRPKGYYTQFKQWPITPMSSNQYWSPDQIVRFLITIKNGVMDPYRSHIQILAGVNPQTYPVGSLQVDSSAQSFIAQTVVSSNNVQIQRITQYDTLACYLTDVGFSQYVCQSRQVQGLGYSNIPSHYPYSTTTLSNSQTTYSSDPTMLLQTMQQLQTGLTMPSRMSQWIGKTNNISPDPKQNPYALSGIFQGNAYSQSPSMSNYLWQKPAQYDLQSTITNSGRFMNLRTQYASSVLQNNYPDVSHSKLLTGPFVLNQTYLATQLTQNSTTSGFNPKSPYTIGFQNVCNTNIFNGNTGVVKYQNIPNACNIWGYQKPICSQFARGTKQSFISPTVPQCQMRNGQILPQKMPVLAMNFNMPLISTICGILIPPDQFLLIPMQALYNLLLQVTLSRYAMFTSGYSDVHQFDQRGMQTMQQRNWVISQIYWNIHLYTFADEGINRQIQSSLVKGIPISSTSYALASQFQIPSGQSVRNSWPIATQAQSLCQIICIFLSNQYQQYTFCRKQFRLSNCVSSMQIKLNTQFYPSQPVVGNAGNPQTLDTTGDVWPFYQLLLLSSNFLFNTNIPLPKINTKNFCINGRCYDVANRSTHYDKNMFNNPDYVWTQNSVNSDTAMGYPSFHQNRYVGKAAYVYSWQPYGHSKQYMTGINTQGVQNFQIVFNTINDKPYPKDQTLLIFTRQNVIVIYDATGVKVIGK